MTGRREKLGEVVFYNPEIKKEFLKGIDSDISRYIFSSKLEVIAKEEMSIDRDLYDMNLEEIEEVMLSLESSTSTAAYGNAIRIKEYLEWAFDRKLRKNDIHPLSSKNLVEWSKQFVLRYTRSFFTQAEIYEMCNALENYVDKALLLAIFEGIGGKGYSELLKLRVADMFEYDGNNFVKLINKDGSDRIIGISSILANYIKAADGESEYQSAGGYGALSRSEYVDSPFVFKKVKKGKQVDGLDNFYVVRKFAAFKKFFGLTYIRAKDVSYSGMMSMANDRIKENNLLTREVSDLIGERYNTPQQIVAGKHYRNRTVIRRVLEVPEYEKMYGYSIIF